MSSRDSSELELQIQYRLLEDLGRSERHYRGILDRLGEIVFECDEDQLLSFLNAAWKKILGHEVADSIGKPIEDFVDPKDRAILQDPRKLTLLNVLHNFQPPALW